MSLGNSLPILPPDPMVDAGSTPAISLCDFDVASLQSALTQKGFNPFHAKSILRNFYASAGEAQFHPRQVGQAISDWLGQFSLPLVRSKILKRTVSGDGTTKLLIQFPDQATAECVLMPTHLPGRAMACVSSQVGCAMGCDFCASTRRGLQRNLSAGEIAEQFLHLSRVAKEDGRRITSLVFMGMGEPMHNLDNVIGGVRRIADNEMGNLGWRQITISTVGIVPGIDRLAAEDLNVHLALSLHAPDDATRAKLVPMTRKYRVAEIVEAARRYQDKTGRIVTIEYCLLAGVNDSADQARQLAELLRGFRAHVNLIPYNAIGAGLTGVVYERPTDANVADFLHILRSAGCVTHVRRTRGDDVAAACGQLREAHSVKTSPLAASQTQVPGYLQSSAAGSTRVQGANGLETQ